MHSTLNETVYIYPTDTVWGIGAGVFSERGNSSVHKIKHSDPSKPLSIVFPTTCALKSYLNLDKIDGFLAQVISSDIWNQQITILMPKNIFKKDIPRWVIGESDYVGIRVLEEPSVLAIYNILQMPFTTTSLNITGSPVIECLQEVKIFMNDISLEIPVKLVNEDKIDVLSSASSSLIAIDKENGKLEIIRKGARWEESFELLKLLST